MRTWNWEKTQDGLNQCRLVQQGTKSVILIDPLPRVELFKVHGSINRFTQASASRQIECDLWSSDVPQGLKRVIAVPGDQKYEQVVSMVDTSAKARQAENEAMAFAAIGYGFNDPHLDELMRGRAHSQDCPLLVLTLDLPDEKVNELRGLGKQVWILRAQKRSNGKVDESRTLVYPPGTDAPVILNERLWSCDCFAERILGG